VHFRGSFAGIEEAIEKFGDLQSYRYVLPAGLSEDAGARAISWSLWRARRHSKNFSKYSSAWQHSSPCTVTCALVF
jgi:hypothetical protein